MTSVKLEKNQLSAGIDPNGIPAHIAIIMDGNGRWARQRGLPRVAGHKVGVDSVWEVVRACHDVGVKVLTLYAFSTENWLRPRAEVAALMKLLFWTLRKVKKELLENSVRLEICGNTAELPDFVNKEIDSSKDMLKNGRDMVLNLAL